VPRHCLQSATADISVLGAYVDWNEDPWRVIAVDYYVDVNLDQSNRNESFSSDYLQIERQLPKRFTVFGRLEDSARMQYSHYVALFDDHRGDIDVALRRQALGLRWDYVRRQALTIEGSKVVSLTRRSNEIRAQWSAVIPVKNHTATAVLLLLLAVAAPAWADEQLVLIVSANSKIEQLDSLEVRKLFLGLTVTHNGERVRPSSMKPMPMSRKYFCRTVVSMSDITYDPPPAAAGAATGPHPAQHLQGYRAIDQGVAADPIAVSYAWAKDVARNPDVKIIRVLWHD